MSFATQLRAFAAQAARERREILGVRIQPLATGGTATGQPVLVSLTPPRAEQQVTENGISVVVKAQLRVLKGGTWTPAERSEFQVVDSGAVWRCETAQGALHEFAAEIVCDVVRLSP